MSSTDHQPAGQVALVVADRDSLDDVLDRLWLEAGRAVRLAVSPGSSLLLTASEFRVLKEVADHRGVGLTLETDDPLRVQLAGLFGLPAVRAGGPLGPRRLPDSPFPPIDRWAEPPGPRLAPAPPPGNGHLVGSPPPQDAIEAGPRFREPGRPFTVRDVEERTVFEVPARAPAPPPPTPVVHPPPAPVVAPSPPPVLRGASFGRPPGPPNAPPAPIASVAAPSGGRFDELRAAAERRAARRRRGANPRAILLTAGGLALLLAFAAAALVLILPSATVTLDLKDQTLVAEQPFRVVPPGEEPDAGEPVVRGEAATVEVSYTTTIETTGIATIGETAAQGTVLLANPTDEPVSIPAGSTGVGDAGAEFRFVDEVTVPAAEDGAGGQAEAAVELVEPGEAGNLGAGELSGVLDSGVYFSNRLAPLAGGTDREGRGVAQADLDALTATFEEELPRLADARFAETLPAGVAVVGSSLAAGEPRVAFDRAAGEPAESVTLTATVEVRGLTYRPAVVMAEAEPRLRESLQAQLPAGYDLDPAAVTFSEPESAADDGPGGATVVVTASGRAVYRFTDEERAALAEELEGSGADDAAELLSGVPAVDSFDVDYFPGLLVERMPRQADRIEIDVHD